MALASPSLPELTPTKPRHNLNPDNEETRLPGLVLLVSDTLIEHYWATIRRKIRRQNTTDRKNRRILGWEGLMYLGKAIEQVCQSDPCWKTIQGGMSIDAVVDAFMRAVPRFKVTRPRFLSTLHFLFGLKVAPTIETMKEMAAFTSSTPSCADRSKRKINRRLLDAVENYFDGFDLDKTGTIDWRDLVCRLRLLFLPMETPQEHLMFCFELFTADQKVHPRPGGRGGPFLRPEKVCHLCGMYATTEIYELLMFNVARKAYDRLPTVLKVTHPKTRLPIVTAIAFREMLTVQMTNTARLRRSESARSIALRHSKEEEEEEEEDLMSTSSEDSFSESDSDTELGATRKTSVVRHKRLKSPMKHTKHTKQQPEQPQQPQQQPRSPWAIPVEKKKRATRKRPRKVVPTLGYLMAPTREVAIRGPHRLVTTYNLEASEYFNLYLHPLAIQLRTEADNMSKLRNFVKRWKAVKRIKVLEVWKYWAYRRKRLREIIIPAASRFYVRNTTVCMFAMKIGAVQECSSIIVQRAFRGHLYGREQAHFLRYQIKHANILQRWWVKSFQWIMWMRRMIRRSRCAKLLQRIIRGYIGRCRARHKLILHYEKEWEKILIERENIRIRHENNAAVFLQCRYRGMIARRYYETLLVKKRAKEMEQEMLENQETEETRRTKLYQQKLKNYWLEQKDLVTRSVELAQYDYQAQWDLKLAKLKRRWQRERNKKEEEDEIRQELDEREKMQWEEDWELKIESGGVQEAARVLQLYETGGSGNQKDKDKSNAIRILIQAKTAEIKQKFRSSGVPLTEANAKVKAKIIAQETYSKAAIAKLEIQRDEDRILVAENKQLEWEAEAKMNGNLNEQKRQHALHIVLGNVRKYHARQEVKRRIRFNYRKEFDVEYNVFFYKHRNNGTFRWDKPKLLGRSDLPAPKRWYHIRDTSFVPGASYWLKPRTAEMTFDLHSLNCYMCEKHVNEFATHYCVDCTVFNCESCHLGKIAKTDSDPNVRLIVLVCGVWLWCVLWLCCVSLF